MEATYLSDIELTDETLQHYGVKGMKWRHRKGTTKSALANDPRYQAGYIVKPGDERARLNRLNPASSRSKPVTTATKKSSSSSSGGSSGSSKGKGGSKKAVKDILSRFKLTKGGKGSSSSKATKEKAAKGSSSSSKKESTSSKKTSSTEKKESTSSKATATSSKTEEKKTTATQQQPQVIEKTRVSEDYTKYLERELGKANYSKLQNETIQDRIKATDAQKKRRARGVRKIYTRS